MTSNPATPRSRAPIPLHPQAASVLDSLNPRFPASRARAKYSLLLHPHAPAKGGTANQPRTLKAKYIRIKGRNVAVHLLFQLLPPNVGPGGAARKAYADSTQHSPITTHHLPPATRDTERVETSASHRKQSIGTALPETLPVARVISHSTDATSFSVDLMPLATRRIIFSLDACHGIN